MVAGSAQKMTEKKGVRRIKNGRATQTKQGRSPVLFNKYGARLPLSTTLRTGKPDR
jgi:hypothetical protein